MQDFDAHLELHRSETFVSDYEKGYEKFVSELEKLLGLNDLDGNQDEDGYSLDTAHDLFADGCTANEAAIELRVLIAEASDEDCAYENDGQPTMHDEYQDLYGGDDFFEQWEGNDGEW